MSYRHQDSNRSRLYESPGSIDFPFDRDGTAAAGLQSDAACTIAWRADGHEAIQVFVDPGLVDRAADLCATLESLAATHRTLDRLSAAVMAYADEEELSASIYESTRDELSTGIVAIAFTIG